MMKYLLVELSLVFSDSQKVNLLHQFHHQCLNLLPRLFLFQKITGQFQLEANSTHYKQSAVYLRMPLEDLFLLFSHGRGVYMVPEVILSKHQK